MPVLTIDKQYQDGVILTEEQLDAAFSSITSLINTTGLGSDNIQDNSIGSAEIQTGAVTNTKLANASVSTVKIQDEAILLAKLDPTLRLSLLPPGVVLDYGADTPPAGWLICDGGEYSRTTYSDLFAIIGATFGNGNGTTTFNVPDVRGMVRRMPGGISTTNTGLRDPDAGGRVSITDWSTSKTGIGSVQKSMYEAHNHGGSTVNGSAGTAGGGSGSASYGGGGNPSQTPLNMVVNGGSETRMINVYFNCIVKT